ncbi:unnamed protein product [Moneuplotes crassus]|uniref:RNA polymerase II-associated protein 3 n=2 Tax=Euplotes crassus TaxID=5936 RepID=A0AAD2D6S4_EUPCR|nr:unnamed protein product [Moneuplotes crassus]
MSSKEKYPIEKVSFEWVEECNDRKEIKKAYEAIKDEGGYYDLEMSLKNKLAKLDPSFRRRINEKPMSKEEKENIANDLDAFLHSANTDDQSLLGKNAQNIFENPKEEAAKRIGKRKQAENERMKGNDFMGSKEYDKAIESYDKSISLDANEPSTYSNRSLAYLKKKMFSKAIEDANKALELDPDYIKAYFRRGKAYEGLTNFEAAIKDYEYIHEKEPKNKKIKKELLSLRSAYKEHSDKKTTKKFQKIKIVEEESSTKIEEITEKKPAPVSSQPKSEEPVIQDEAKEEKPVVQEETKVVEPKTEPKVEPVVQEETKTEPKPSKDESKFVKVAIEEESSEDEEELQEAQKSDVKEQISKNAKNLLATEKFSEDFEESLEADAKAEFEAEQNKKEEKPQSTKKEQLEETKGEEDHVEEIKEPEITEEEKLELELLERIDDELAEYKNRAKEEHSKGMFDIAISIYEEALVFLDSQESQFKYQISALIAKKCALWNNIAACYKQYQNDDKEIEYSSLVIANAEHLKSDPNILYKAYYRRGCAYDKAEKYQKAKIDIQYCREKRPFDTEISKRMNHINEALKHAEEEKKTRSMMSSSKLRSTLEEIKTEGNKAFSSQKLDEAIESFTKGIEVYKDNQEVVKLEKCTDLTKIAISLFTNRALCYSKQRRDANVIADTTYVIENLSRKNVKAYYRRALAYKNFGQYKDSLSDLNKILEFESNNKDARKEQKVVKELYEKELKKQMEKQMKKQMGEMEGKKKKEEKKATSKTKVEEVKSTGVKVKEISPEEAQAAKSKTSEPVQPKKKVKIDDEVINKAAELASKTIGKDKVRIPNTTYGFESDLNSLKKDPENLYNYISQIPPSVFSKLYKDCDINPDYLVLILNSVTTYEKNADKILELLYNFSKTSNFSMTVMFFTDEDRSLYSELVTKAEEATISSASEMLAAVKAVLE